MTGEWRPEMPTYGDPPARVAVPVVLISGQRLLLLPMRAPVGPFRGRRYRVTDHNGHAHVRLVLVVSGRAALRAPAGLPAAARSVTVTIEALRPTRRRGLPCDLSTALASAGADLDQLTEAARDQLLQMVGESSTIEIRAARIQAAVDAVLASGYDHE